MMAQTHAIFFNKGDMIFGRSFSEWTAKWWQAFRYANWRRNLGPVFMIPGAWIAENDSGMVKGNNKFKIKRDKAILFAVINCIQQEEYVLQSIMTMVKQRMDVVDVPAIQFMLDGEPMMDHICRVNSPTFMLHGNKCASDGFWLFLRPNTLDPGYHLITSYGTCSSGKTQIGNDTNIEIIL